MSNCSVKAQKFLLRQGDDNSGISEIVRMGMDLPTLLVTPATLMGLYRQDHKVAMDEWMMQLAPTLDRTCADPNSILCGRHLEEAPAVVAITLLIQKMG
jgi:hypothetical protein